MRREPTEVKTQGGRGQARLGERAEPRLRARAATSKRSRLRRLALNSLEPRQLLAVAPVPVASNQAQILRTGSDKIDDSSPWVAIDPTNANKMATVFTRRDNTRGTTAL